jgi:hypothetical protein
MFSLFEIDFNTGMFDSKGPMKKNNNKNKPAKKNGKQRNQNRKICTNGVLESC